MSTTARQGDRGRPQNRSVSSYPSMYGGSIKSIWIRELNEREHHHEHTAQYVTNMQASRSWNPLGLSSQACSEIALPLPGDLFPKRRVWHLNDWNSKVLRQLPENIFSNWQLVTEVAVPGCVCSITKQQTKRATVLLACARPYRKFCLKEQGGESNTEPLHRLNPNTKAWIRMAIITIFC